MPGAYIEQEPELMFCCQLHRRVSAAKHTGSSSGQVLVGTYIEAATAAKHCQGGLLLVQHGAPARQEEESNRQLQPERGHRVHRQCLKYLELSSLLFCCETLVLMMRASCPAPLTATPMPLSLP